MSSVPVLMYHRIADIAGDRNSVSPVKFEEQLACLCNNGYTTISLSQLYGHHGENNILPTKSVVLTFDDGYLDNYEQALPLLLKYKMKAVVFPVGEWVGRNNGWEDYPGKPHCMMMDWRQLREWRQAGMEVGSHTITHPFLSHLTKVAVQYELIQSKQLLEDKLGQAIDFFCYPYGDFSPTVRQAVQAAGYKMAMAIFAGTSLWQDDLFAMPRQVISSRLPLWEFRLKVSPVHEIFTAMRLAEKYWKHKIRKKP